MGVKLATEAALIGALTSYDATLALVCFSVFRFRTELYSRRQPHRRLDGVGGRRLRGERRLRCVAVDLVEEAIA